jgi:exonuclease SbcC
MKPVRLRLQAFGPFAREQVLDFAQLQDRGFFLIHGPTGAGKTSILDGLCFALFGDSSGDERQARELRSHHADPALRTEAELVFALGDALYRVRRVPEQMRKARRGDGLVKQLAEAELHRLPTAASFAVHGVDRASDHRAVPAVDPTSAASPGAGTARPVTTQASATQTRTAQPHTAQLPRSLATATSSAFAAMATATAEPHPSHTATPPGGSASTADPTAPQLLASGWTDVTRRITALLGFQSAQFRQVIVLAQGQFSQFLKANSREREPILQVLFGTELYKRIEESLKRAADEIAVQARQAGAQRQTLLEQGGVADEAALQARIEAGQLQWQSRQAEEAQAHAVLAQASQALQAGLAAERAWAEQAEAAAALQAVQAREAEAAAWRARREAAERAARIQPQAQAHAAAAQALARAQADAAALAQAQRQADAALATAGQALQALQTGQSTHEAQAERLRQLEQLLLQATALAEARAALAQAAQWQADAARALAQAQAAEATASARHQALQAEAQALQPQALRLEWLARTQSDLAARGQALEALASAEDAAGRAGQAAERAAAEVAVAEQARGQTQAARAACWQQWLAGQAARLAHALHAGEPCPVCGSAEHPAPAPAGAPGADDAALAAADAAQQAASDALEAARQRWAQARQAQAEAAAQAQARRQALGEGPTGEALAEALAQATREADAARQAAARIARLQAELPAALEHATRAGQALRQAQAAAQDAAASHAAAQARADERAAGLPAGLDTPQALQDEAGALRAALQAWQARLAAAEQARRDAELAVAGATARRQAGHDALARATGDEARQAQAWAAALATAGFANTAAHAAASRPEAERQALAQAIEAQGQALAAAVARDARARAAVDGLAVPELPALHAAAEQARQACTAAAKATEQAHQVLQADQRLAQRLQVLGDSHAALEARHRVLRSLADTATGQNQARLSFQRYVLATLLEEVLAAATLRLRAMSRGRYALQRRPDPTDARSAGGLELDVHDEHTGTTRPVHTLSGGESFMASLALALGLADVVQAQSGGVRLDALFVDEGFGTLDPEALEMAIRTLKDLQASGRLVGIISHVAELKEWIPTRLELRASPAGSTAAFVL